MSREPVSRPASSPAAREPPARLWWAPLDVGPGTARRLAAHLSPAERDRAGALRRDRDRARFVASRGWLRELLAAELGCAAATVPLAATPVGVKPHLDGIGLRFATSRSAGVALYATSAVGDVGVDVEALRDIPDVDGLLARFGAPAERRALARLPDRERRAALFALWTRKEAYLKGVGVGLAVPPAGVDVWNDGRPRAVVGGWTVHAVALGPGFAAAVAVPGDVPWAPAAPCQLADSQAGAPGRPC